MQIEKQLAAWASEKIPRLSQRKKTRNLVLKYRMDRFAREEAQRAEVIDRLMSPYFPPKLLRQVVRAAAQHHACYWSATGEGTLEMRTNRIFLLPDSVAPTTRSLLQQLAREDLLKLSMIKTPAFFTAEHTLQLPPALEEKGHHLHLRHLVLDLRTTPIHGGYNRELNKGTKSMASLSNLFPRLSVCVFLLHFKNISQYGHETFNSDILRFKNAKVDASGKWEYVDLKATILDFMTAFARSGPGKRKLLRFSTNLDVLNAEGKGCDAGIGPLVGLSGLMVSRSVEEATASNPEEGADREQSSIACAECVFDEAYWSRRVLRRRDGTKGTKR